MHCSPNVTRYEGALSRVRRWRALDVSGTTVWLTGLPASGKSTIGGAVEERLVERGLPAYLLDGDELRHGICGHLAFSRADREENVRRVGELARLFADSGTIAIAAVVSPYERTRCEVRERHERDGLPFFEVFVDTPLAICAERDPKGLYARSLAGELVGLTGIDDPYEPPGFPDLRLTPELAVTGAVNAVLELLPAWGVEQTLTAAA
jgi:adenylyl-sulfate kinase